MWDTLHDALLSAYRARLSALLGWDHDRDEMRPINARPPCLNNPNVVRLIAACLRSYGDALRAPIGMRRQYAAQERVYGIARLAWSCVTRETVTRTFEVPDEMNATTVARVAVGDVVHFLPHAADPFPGLPWIGVVLHMRKSRGVRRLRVLHLDRPDLTSRGAVDSSEITETEVESVLNAVRVSPDIEQEAGASNASGRSMRGALVPARMRDFVRDSPCLAAIHADLVAADGTDPADVPVVLERVRNSARLFSPDRPLVPMREVEARAHVPAAVWAALLRGPPFFASDSLVALVTQISPVAQRPPVVPLEQLADMAMLDTTPPLRATAGAVTFQDFPGAASLPNSERRSAVDQWLPSLRACLLRRRERLTVATASRPVELFALEFCELCCGTHIPQDMVPMGCAGAHRICASCDSQILRAPVPGSLLATADFTCPFCRSFRDGVIDDPDLRNRLAAWIDDGAQRARLCECGTIVCAPPGACAEGPDAIPPRCVECTVDVGLPEGFASWLPHEQRRLGRHPRPCPGCEETFAMNIGDWSCSHGTCECGHEFCIVCETVWDDDAQISYPEDEHGLYPPLDDDGYCHACRRS